MSFDLPICAEPQRDPDMWFSEEPTERAKAKGLCSTCPFKLACLEQGMGESYGVWGGLTLQDRRKVTGQILGFGSPEDWSGWTMADSYCPACKANPENFIAIEREIGARWPWRGAQCGLCGFEFRSIRVYKEIKNPGSTETQVRGPYKKKVAA